MVRVVWRAHQRPRSSHPVSPSNVSDITDPELLEGASKHSTQLNLLLLGVAQRLLALEQRRSARHSHRLGALLGKLQLPQLFGRLLETMRILLTTLGDCGNLSQRLDKAFGFPAGQLGAVDALHRRRVDDWLLQLEPVVMIVYVAIHHVQRPGLGRKLAQVLFPARACVRAYVR